MRFPICCFVLSLTAPVFAQQSLHTRLIALEAESGGQLNMACSLPDVHLDCNLHSDAHAPMQSTMKLPIGMTILHLVDEHKLSLDQSVHFGTETIWPGTHSPIQDAHPQANVDLPLRDLLRVMVSDSDNIAAELLLPLAGGPDGVRAYLATIGITGLHIIDGERAMQRTWEEQYLDWAQPEQMVKLLRLLADRNPLSPSSAALLNKMLEDTTTGPDRIKGLLPIGTIVAHKTGSGGTRDGITSATNDVALITLPATGGKKPERLALAIYLTDSKLEDAGRDRIIAEAAHAVYDAAIAAR